MTWQTVTVDHDQLGRIEARAFPTTTPGLVVVPPDAVPHSQIPPGEEPWCLVHARSGGSVAYCRGPEAAQAAAAALAGLIDWTLSGAAIRASHIAEQAWKLTGPYVDTTYVGSMTSQEALEQ